MCAILLLSRLEIRNRNYLESMSSSFHVIWKIWLLEQLQFLWSHQQDITWQEIHERVISLFWGFAWLPVVPYWNNQLMTDSNPLQGSNDYRALEPAVNITMNSDLNNPPTRRQRNKSHNPQQDCRWLRMVCYNSPWWGLYRRRCWMIWWCRNTILVSLFKIRFLVLFYPVELYVNRLLLKVVWVGGSHTSILTSYLESFQPWCEFFIKFCPAVAEILQHIDAKQISYGKPKLTESLAPDDEVTHGA